MKKKTIQRQAIVTNIKQLRVLIFELQDEEINEDQKTLIPIINKDGMSDTWQIERPKIKKLKYRTKKERLEQGLCPLCETSLMKHCHISGHEDSFDKTPECRKCGWRDS